VTIDGATIGGIVKTQDATATNPLIIRDSNITGSITIGNAQNVEITGTTASDIIDGTENGGTCNIAANTEAAPLLLCPLT